MRIKILLIFSFFICVQVNAQFGAEQVITLEAMGARSVIASDLDGDSMVDILSASQFDSKVSWYRNTDGLGTFGPQNVIALLNQTNSVYAADLDGDTDKDVLAVSGPDDQVVWYENLDGLGNFGTAQVVTSLADGAFKVIAADIDGDTDMDVVSASDLDNEIVWYENLDGLGNFGVGQVISSLSNGRSVVASDIDDDNDLDIVVSSSGSVIVAWFENVDGLGSFGPQQIIGGPGNAVVSVYSIDLDGDLDMDVLTAAPVDNRISWYENLDGLGNFGTEQIITNNADFALSVFAIDLDHDNDVDVLSASADDNKIAWYENDGLGNFGAQQIISTNAVSARDVIAADIDDDSSVDVISASQNDHKIAWYRNLTLGITALDYRNLIVYPNPVADILIIESKNTVQINTITVYDMLGNLVLTQVDHFNRVNMAHLNSGIFIINVETENGVFLSKVIRQ